MPFSYRSLMDLRADCYACSRDGTYRGAVVQDKPGFVEITCFAHDSFRVYRPEWLPLIEKHARLAEQDETYRRWSEALLSYDPPRMLWFFEDAWAAMAKEAPPLAPFFLPGLLPQDALFGSEHAAWLLVEYPNFWPVPSAFDRAHQTTVLSLATAVAADIDRVGQAAAKLSAAEWAEFVHDLPAVLTAAERRGERDIGSEMKLLGEALRRHRPEDAAAAVTSWRQWVSKVTEVNGEDFLLEHFPWARRIDMFG